MAVDFKKEYKALYVLPDEPEIVTVPPVRYAAVRGAGDLNAAYGDYQHHEIYLSDARKVPPEKWRTIIRHPVKRCEYGSRSKKFEIAT